MSTFTPTWLMCVGIVYVGIFAYTPVCIHTKVYTNMHVHLFVGEHIHFNMACICRYVCIHTYMYVYRVYVGIYIRAYKSVCW